MVVLPMVMFINVIVFSTYVMVVLPMVIFINTLSKLVLAQTLPPRPGGADGLLHAQDFHPQGMRTNTYTIFLAVT